MFVEVVSSFCDHHQYFLIVTHHAVIPSAPGPVVMTFSNSGPSSFTVSWSEPSSPVVGGNGGYMFGVTGDCGDCMNMTVSADTRSVTCSGWTANDQTCTFEVRTLTQDCGFISDPTTSNVTLSGEFLVHMLQAMLSKQGMCIMYIMFVILDSHFCV